MATYELKNNGKDLKSSADVRVGDLKDMEEDDDYYTYAYVAKPDDSDDPAELVYIVKQEKSEYKAISLTVDGTAVSAAAATLKAGETYSYTYTAPDGKLIDTVAGIAAADYTVAADGKSVAISFKVKDKTDIAITLKNEPAAPETRTLTLKGNLIDPTLATVWTDASTEIEGTPIKEFGKVTAMEYKIPENAAVTIMDSDITDVGTVRINGILIDTNAGELTFTMSDDLTLTGAPTAGAAVFTLTAGEGIVLKDADGNEITGPVASGTQVTVESETGYYLQDKVADATGVADTNKVTVTADTAVYAASKVELKQGAAATYGTSNTAVNDGNYVALGTELKVTAAGKSGVVVGTTGDAITTYVVTKDDVVLNGAWKVELTDVTATIGGKAIGAYVADGQTLTATVATGAGTHVIEVEGNNKFNAAEYTPAALSADLELAAATSVEVDANCKEVTYKGSNGKDIVVLATGADTTAYVMPGTVLTVEGAKTVNGADATAEGDFLTFTVGTDAISITNP